MFLEKFVSKQTICAFFYLWNFYLSFQKGYDDLQTIVPTCHQPNNAAAMQKLSKAIILQKCKTMSS